MRTRYIRYSVLFCLVAFLLFLWLSFGQNGLFDLFTMQAEKEETMAILNDLKAKNRDLASEIRRLKTDPEYFESVARKELGLVGENEIIYRVTEGQRGVITRPIQKK
jgi:cell division protein FtsB